MGRLFLAAADTDAAYLEGLLNYFSYAYSDRFRISSFTVRESLMKFISDYGGTIDILLISPQLYSDQIPENKVNTLIILSSGRLYEGIKSHGVISKYQHGDRVAAEVINIYSRTNKNEIISADGDKKTRVTAVYSPAGGTGKTTVAISTCVKCAKKGLKVLYLSFENISLLPVLFKYRQTPNFSNIIYYLKDGDKNLGFKIEGIRCIDPESGLHFFAPPDSGCELDELLPEDIDNLIMQIRNMHYYDAVFIDMSSSLNRRSLSLMASCDELFLITTQEEAASTKLKVFENELIALSNDGKKNICDKTVLIINKGVKDMTRDLKDMVFDGKAAAIVLPAVRDNMSAEWIRRELAEDGYFSRGINQLADRFI